MGGTTFDALVNHLKMEKVKVHRHDNFDVFRKWGQGASSAAGAGKEKEPEAPVDAAVRILSKRRLARPAKRKTLARFLRFSIGTELSKQEAQDAINQLSASGKIVIKEKNSVSYLF